MISIIANFYKSERFIPKLVNSVIQQTYQDWELICVNDCSPQDDLKVLLKFADKDKRIKIVNNKENLGISRAKFEGIKHATGKYLMFIDGDDWLEPEALAKCIEPAEQYDVDMVIMSSQKVLYWGFPVKKNVSYNSDVNRVISQPELFDRYYLNFFGINLFSVTYWGKLIRRDAFDRAHLEPSGLDYSEDEIFNMMLFPHLRSMYMLDYVGYNWRWGGITSGRLAATIKRVIKLLTFVMNFYDRRMQLIVQYNYEKAKRPLTIELVNYLISEISSIASNKECDENLLLFIKQYLEKIHDNRQYLFDCKGEKYDVIFNGNAKDVYLHCYNLYHKNIVKNTIKRIVHSIVD